VTLYEIKAEAAAYLNVEVSALTVGSADLFVGAANRVRKRAELNNDFEFQRRLVTVSVDGVTGGSLDDAVVFGTDDSVSVKTVLDVGQFDADGNLRASRWTTVAEGLERQRKQNSFAAIRYPRDGDIVGSPLGGSRFNFSNRQVYFFPVTENQTFELGLEVYIFDTDWTTDDVEDDADVSDIWTTHGAEYILWGSIIELNYRFKEFVPREEANLTPPTELMRGGLESLITWDVGFYEQFRRHD
jgi:hypothetical protein